MFPVDDRRQQIFFPTELSFCVLKLLSLIFQRLIRRLFSDWHTTMLRKLLRYTYRVTRYQKIYSSCQYNNRKISPKIRGLISQPHFATLNQSSFIMCARLISSLLLRCLLNASTRIYFED